MNNMRPPIERHPWPPYIPDGARYLFLGTFPPKPICWSMEFFYPNKTNDFWKIMGLLFMNDREALWDSASGRYDLAAIKSLLDHEGIALWDTAMAVRRLKDNASEVPPIGQPLACRVGTHAITLWRMPSTSRAYPLALEKKAEAYRVLFPGRQ